MRTRSILGVLLFAAILVGLALGIRLALGENVLGADFYTFWKAGRALFLQHQSPYSTQVIEETQFGLYHRLALPSEDQVAFVYPLYMTLLVLPLTLVDFPLAQALWMAFYVLLFITIVRTIFSNRSLGLVFSSLLFFPIAFGIFLGNFDFILGILLLIFFWAHQSGKLRFPAWRSTLGIGLAFVAGKPQFSYLILIVCILIVLRYQYWRTLAFFISSLLVLLAGSFLLLPSWLAEWVSRLREYSQYVPMAPLTQSVIDILSGNRSEHLLTPILFLGLAVFLAISLAKWWRRALVNPHPGADLSSSKVVVSAREIFNVGLAGIITYAFHPTRFSYEQIILFVPFFLWAAATLQKIPKAVILFWLTGLAVGWAALFLSRFDIFTQAEYVLPLLFFAGWLIYLWLTPRLTPHKDVAHAPS